MDGDLQLGAGMTAFIISPIGSRMEPPGSPGRARYEESVAMWEEVFEPACIALGLAAIRADKITDTGEIPEQIFTYLRDADVVVADLSHANPNVMYELGLRHSRSGKITIQVGEYGQLPFDVTTIRTIQFRRSTAGLIEARNGLVEALRTALAGGGTVLRATTVFNDAPPVSAEIVQADVDKSATTDAVAEAPEEGILDMLVDGETAMGHIAEVLGQSTATLNLIGETTSAATRSLHESDAGGHGFAGRLLVAKKLAEDLRNPSDSFEQQANEFFADVQRVDAMVTYMVDRLRSGVEDPSESIGFLNSGLALVDAAEQSAVGITNYRESIKGLRKQSKLLDAPAKALERGASRMLEGIAILSAWRSPMTEVLPDPAATVE